MKRINLVVVLMLLMSSAFAQDIKFPGLDTSPADIVYYPLNAAKVKTNDIPLIKVVYSRPAKKGREIFGVLEQFGKVWRVGANESTVIKFTTPVKIGGKRIATGEYSLFAIPNKDKWTLILNTQIDRWGAYAYNADKDVTRIDVPVTPLSTPLENLSITFVPKDKAAVLVIGWDTTSVQLPIEFF